jgi:hypothetical protein
MGWRRGLIRFVLACNWTVAGMSLGMGLYPHFGEWFSNAEDLVLAEQGKPPLDPGPVVEREPMTEEQHEAYMVRCEHYRQLTYPLYRSGRNAWLFVSGTSAVTAVLLMIAFPKKTPPP